MTTTQTDAGVEELEPWGRRAATSGEAETSGTSFLAQEGLPGVGVTGIWECTPGSWNAERRALTEVAFILSGRGSVTDADGQQHDLRAGVVLILPAGRNGQWTIAETLRKFYVVAPSLTS